MILPRRKKKSWRQKKNKAYVESLASLSAKDLLPGASNFIESVKEKKVICSLASASKNAPYIIEKLGIADYFDAIVDASTLKKSKPDPEIFIKGAEIIGIKPEDAVGFEDAQAGIEAIKRADMYAVGVETEKPLVGADITVSRLDQLSVDDLLNK